MLALYSLLICVTFLLLLPLLLLRREKYMSGFRERLGNYPAFISDSRRVVWIHCVSVGETNAARQILEALRKELPSYRFIISTTTKTGQELAKSIFHDKADAIFYFPFDLKFAVRKALDHFKPSAVLLMETEIWPRFLSEAKKRNVKTSILNGRLSERSAKRYSMVKPLIAKVLQNIDLALMQSDKDAARLIELGKSQQRVAITGNVKFDISVEPAETEKANELESRFHFSGKRPLIVAASTHEPEERIILEAFCSLAVADAFVTPRLLIVPRHPERFDAVAKMLDDFRNDPLCEWREYTTARRSNDPTANDSEADIILLDSIGELRSVYSFAEIVFVGGSLIPHGGQSLFEPAFAGKAIITGAHTHNFTEAVNLLIENNALIRLPDKPRELIVDEVFDEMYDLLEFPEERKEIGKNAALTINANRGAVQKTVDRLRTLLTSF